MRIDIHDNHHGAQSGSCAVCCCEPLSLRAGETRLVTLNYAPWVIPIIAGGGPGLVGIPDFSIEENSDACSTSAIDGFAPPEVLQTFFVAVQNIAVSTDLQFKLSDDLSPAGNAYSFKLVPVSGPYHGALIASPLDGDEWIYSPSAGYVGYDQFWVEITDAQGRTIIRAVNINVGGATGVPPKGWGPSASMGLQIDRSKIRVNRSTQTVAFPLYLPPSNSCDTIDGCKRYRVTTKAYAQDCDTTFTQISCIDVRCGGC